MRKNFQLVVLDEYGGVTVKTTEAHPSLKELQRIVDGYIEVVSFSMQSNRYLMIVDEEGVFNNKRLNRRASELFGAHIFGPAVILQEDGEEMAAFISCEIPYVLNDIMLSTSFGEIGMAVTI